jgi:hypothetical protein
MQFQRTSTATPVGQQLVDRLEPVAQRVDMHLQRLGGRLRVLRVPRAS